MSIVWFADASTADAGIPRSVDAIGGAIEGAYDRAAESDTGSDYDGHRNHGHDEAVFGKRLAAFVVDSRCQERLHACERPQTVFVQHASPVVCFV